MLDRRGSDVRRLAHGYRESRSGTGSPTACRGPCTATPPDGTMLRQRHGRSRRTDQIGTEPMGLPTRPPTARKGVLQFDDLRRVGLFAGTDDDQLRTLLEVGSEVPFGSGEVLFQENTPADSWWVLLDGSIDLVRHVGSEETRLGVMDTPGRWAGGFRAWDEHGVYPAPGRAATAGRVLRVPATQLRTLWADRFSLGLYLIEGVSRSARNYESMARQKESLAALGTLAAGLAHQLNNPAAAATRAADGLGEASAALLVALRRLAAGGGTGARRVGSGPSSSPNWTPCVSPSLGGAARGIRWRRPTARPPLPTGSASAG